MAARKQIILVIGGGSAGATAASLLSQQVDPARVTIQLVADRTYNIHYPAMIRTLVTSQGGFEDLGLNTFDKLFLPGKAGEVVIGAVDHIDDGSAHLADGRSLPYDYLVLATGTIWEGPLTLPVDRAETHQWIADWRQKFANARNIAIIGGGACGIELAGEISHFLPDKTVTLIHAQDQLLNDAYPTKFRKGVADALRNKGVNVILNDRAEVPEGSYTFVTTQKGVKIEADLVVPLRGGRANSGVVATLDPSVIGKTGYVKVLPTLQVPLANGRRNVYAVGDIIDWPQQKSVAKVPAQAAPIVANILSQINGKAAKKEYDGFMEAIVVTLGPTGGRSHLPMLWGVNLGDMMTRTIKSKTLFVELPRKLFNVA